MIYCSSFPQRPSLDNEETYYLIMDMITFPYLISLTISEGLHIYFMDISTTYLYRSMDVNMYMKIPK